MQPHYSLHYSFNKPYFEHVEIRPYYIDSYEDNTNVYAYNERGVLSRNLLLDVPFIKINWEDLEATKEKIRLYILFS